MPVKPCFIVKNKFQIVQFAPLAEAYPDARYLLIDRKTLRNEFTRQDIASSRIPITVVDRETVVKATDGFDVVFFQTVFPGIERLTRPLVSVQYGLAKERHNYGEWRALADMNLMFGPYSARKVEHFSPSHGVGNIKFSGWNPVISKEARLSAKASIGADPCKPLALYMPTYGELGSFGQLAAPLAGLLGTCDVAIKMHHNDERAGYGWMAEAQKHGFRLLFSGDADQKRLLAAADVVVSDFSGAIFDAIYAHVPVVLFQENPAQKIGIQKFDLSSIEFSRRSELGITCERPEDIGAAIQAAMDSSAAALNRIRSVRKELFAEGVDSVKRSTDLVEALLRGDLPGLTTPQLYVRETVQALLSCEAARRGGALSRLWEKRVLQTLARARRGLAARRK